MTLSFNLGALPGNDFHAGMDVIAGETPLRTLVHVPQRGFMYDHMATTLAILHNLPVEKGPRSWRLSTRAQIISRRLWDKKERELDAIEQHWSGAEQLQVSCVGPWSLSTQLELADGHRALTDSGALKDIVDIFLANLIDYAQQLKKRCHAECDIILDEFALDNLIKGRVKGTHDFDILPAYHPKELAELLAHIISTLQQHYRHVRLAMLGQEPNFFLAQLAQPDSFLISQDTIKGTHLYDDLAQALSEGLGIGFGCVGIGDYVDTDKSIPRDKARRIAKLFDELSISREQLADIEIHPRQHLDQGRLIDAAHALACARVCAEIVQRDGREL
ncbi:hypothetical protein EML15_07740 [Corynebacterium sp. sy017]|uniref:hypothetical protein n=1 Tax=unclassified Corynebacterium TaxID=2624378 RepID=UPI0011862CE8|nr:MULTISPECIES: hypothetical protein [unclassified Corynebacterium]MBP3089034.1 hypothetical protein [Corynebacterium sp. sy017]QDZ42399.1 hypothetical protein FQV43_03900 [Corynebacterium sp. sy039]TSD91354.1 hypothetical protein ELY17_07750 [Corynebacterium sp. SY003]